MRKTAPAMPHRNYVKLMLLAGVPLTSKADEMLCITDILASYEFNIHPMPAYVDIEAEIEGDTRQKRMMEKNRPIYEHNSKRENRIQRLKKPLYIDNKVVEDMYMPASVRDLLHMFHGISRRARKMTRTLIMLLNNQTHRQFIEVMLTRGIPFHKMRDYVNDRDKLSFRVTDQDMRMYYEYIWNWRPESEFEGVSLRSLYVYLNMNVHSAFYREHRGMLAVNDFEEVLIRMGSFSEENRKSMNKKLYGVSSVNVMNAMRDGKPLRGYFAQIYMHTDASIAEDQRAADVDDLRKRIDSLFESVDTVAVKRRTLDDIAEEEAAAARKLEPMEPAEIIKR